jgi:hypothetical protein
MNAAGAHNLRSDIAFFHWFDLLGKIGSRFKVQGSRFKVQGSKLF